MPKSTSSSAIDSPNIATHADRALLQRLGTVGLLYGASRWLIHDFLFPYTSAFAASGSASLFLSVLTAAVLYYAPKTVAAYFYAGSMTLIACLTLLARGFSTLEPGYIFVATMASFAFFPNREARILVVTQVALFAASSLYLSMNPLSDTTLAAIHVTLARESAPWLNVVTAAYLCAALTLLSNNFGFALSCKLSMQQDLLRASQKALQDELDTLGNLYRYLNRDILIIDTARTIVAASSQLLAKLQLLEQEIIGTPVERWFEHTQQSPSRDFNHRGEVFFKPIPTLGALLWLTPTSRETANDLATVIELKFPTEEQSSSGTNGHRLLLAPAQALTVFQAHIDSARENCKSRSFLGMWPQLPTDTQLAVSEAEVMAFMRECALILHSLWSYQVLVLDQSALVVVFPEQSEVDDAHIALADETLNAHWAKLEKPKPFATRLSALNAPIMGHRASDFLDAGLQESLCPDQLQQRQKVLEQFQKRGFVMHLQPVMALTRGKPVLFFEALARWPGSDPMPPPVFLSIAKEMGLETAAIRVLFGLFCDAAEDLLNASKIAGHRFSFNIDSENFTDISVRAFIKSRLIKSPLAPSQVVVELTETPHVQDPERLTAAITDMKTWGAKIAIDDFGKSFSSLERLVGIKADIVKLDASLTHRIEQEKLAILVSKIAALANKLDMTVVAEGIETEDQLQALLSLGIDYGQGHFLSRPALPSRFASRTSTT